MRRIALALSGLVALIPNIAFAETAPQLSPRVQYVDVVANQVHIVGENLFLVNEDRSREIQVHFMTENDEFSTEYTFSSIPEPDFGPTVASRSSKELILRIGVLPSTLRGTIVVETPRGSSEPVEFSIDDPYCVVTAPMTSSAIGGDDQDWTATPSNWLFVSDEPTELTVPYVGTLTVPDIGQVEPGFLKTVTTNVAVYDCTEVTTPEQTIRHE